MNKDSTDMEQHTPKLFDAGRDDAPSISEEQIATALRAAGVSVEDVQRLLSGDVVS